MRVFKLLAITFFVLAVLSLVVSITLTGAWGNHGFLSAFKDALALGGGNNLEEEEAPDEDPANETKKEPSVENNNSNKNESSTENDTGTDKKNTSSSEEQEVVRQLTLQIVENSSNQKESLQKVYDWVTHNISYDVAKRGESYYLDTLRTLQTGKGVCGDYADLTKQMLLSIGIEAEMVTGEVRLSDGTIELHAWTHAWADGKKYALDTTWGAGYITLDEQFVRRPVRLFLTTPSELERLHQGPDYASKKRKEYLVDRSLRASPQMAPSYENSIASALNLTMRDDLRREARFEADQISQKVLENWQAVFLQGKSIDPSWSSSLNQIYERVNDPSINNMGVAMFTYWSYPPPTEEEITRKVVQQVDSRNYTSVGVGVIQRLDLVVVYVLMAE